MIVVLVAVPAALSDAEASATERPVNGGFEEGNGPFPTDWAADLVPGLRTAALEAPEGAYVLAYSGAIGTVRSIVFGADGGDWISVDAMVRDAGPAVEIGVEFFRRGVPLGTQTLGPRAPAIEWEPFHLLTLAPVGTTRANVVITGVPATTSFVDAVVVLEL